ncbi:hypothetical protein BDC45DRAFT_573014 [Circinella umbellata]|nr:hypothetical protein BDC45DRAFT_573014 [Circinella umbellata]
MVLLRDDTTGLANTYCTIALDDNTMITCTCPDFVQRGAMYQIRPPSQDALFEESLARFHQVSERLSEQAQRVDANNYSSVAARYLNQVSQCLKNSWSISKTWEKSRSA